MDSIIRQFYEIPGKIISLKSGEYLFHEGETAKNFYFVRSGQIFIMKYAESGRVLSLRLASKGSIIGELPLYYSGTKKYQNQATKQSSIKDKFSWRNNFEIFSG